MLSAPANRCARKLPQYDISEHRVDAGTSRHLEMSSVTRSWLGAGNAQTGILSGATGWQALRARRGLTEAASSDDEALPPLPWQDVKWSVLLVSFLWYVAVITTYHIPGADIAMIVAAIALAANGRQIRIPASLAWMALFLLWAAVGYVFTRFPDPVWDTVVLFAKIWLISLVAANTLRTRAEIRVFTLWLLACFVLYPVRGAYVNYFVDRYAVFGRALWNFIYSNPNDLAALALLQLSLAIGLLITEKKKSWIWMGALASIVLLGALILMTQSRGGTIALGVFIILALVAQRLRLRVLLAVAALVSLAIFVAPSGVWTRMSGLTNATNTEHLDRVDPEGSAKSRFEIWRVASTIIRDHPITGIGLGAYPNAHAVYAREGGFDPGIRKALDTHSTILSLLAETGVVGLTLFVLTIFATVIRAERIRRNSRDVLPRTTMQLLYLEFGLLAFFIAGVFGSFSRLSFLYLHLMLIWTLSERCRIEASRRRPSPA